MAGIRNPVVGAIERWASGLRFPKLVFLITALFLLDVLVPDMIPLIDEILLALLALLLASFRRRDGGRAGPDDGPREEIDVTPRKGASPP